MTYTYKVIKNVTNVYNSQDLQVVGYVEVYFDEVVGTDENGNPVTVQKYLTEIPFSEIGMSGLLFSEVPHDTVDAFNKYIDDMAISKMSDPNIQLKLEQVYTAYKLGLYIPTK